MIFDLASAAHLQIGITKGGEGSYVSLYDSGKTERASITATEKSTQLALNDTKMTVDLGSDLLSDAAGLWLSKDDLTYASIRFNKAKGGSVLLSIRAASRAWPCRQGSGPTKGVASRSPGLAARKSSASSGGRRMGPSSRSTMPRARIASPRAPRKPATSRSSAMAARSPCPRAILALAGYQRRRRDGAVLGLCHQERAGRRGPSGPRATGLPATLGNMGLPASALIGKK